MICIDNSLSDFCGLGPAISHILIKSNKLYGADWFSKRNQHFYHEMFLTFAGLSQGAAST